MIQKIPRLLSSLKNRNTATREHRGEHTHNQTRQETNHHKFGSRCEIPPFVPNGPLEKDVPGRYIPNAEVR